MAYQPNRFIQFGYLKFFVYESRNYGIRYEMVFVAITIFFLGHFALEYTELFLFWTFRNIPFRKHLMLYVAEAAKFISVLWYAKEKKEKKIKFIASLIFANWLNFSLEIFIKSEPLQSTWILKIKLSDVKVKIFANVLFQTKQQKRKKERNTSENFEWITKNGIEPYRMEWSGMI